MVSDHSLSSMGIGFMDKLEALKGKLQAFADARDWDLFHSPKNLSMALASKYLSLWNVFNGSPKNNLKKFPGYCSWWLMKWPMCKIIYYDLFKDM